MTGFDRQAGTRTYCGNSDATRADIKEAAKAGCKAPRRAELLRCGREISGASHSWGGLEATYDECCDFRCSE